MTDISGIFIKNPNGSIYFDSTRVSKAVVYPNNDGKYLLNVILKFHAESYNERELNDIEQKLGCKLFNDLQYVEFHLERFPVETKRVESIVNREFFLQDGDQYDDAIAYLYFGYHIETSENRFSIIQKNSKFFFELEAVSEDLDYYDSNASNGQTKIKVEISEIKFLQSEEEFRKYQADIEEDNGYYYSILRIWQNAAIASEDNIDISNLTKTDSEIENSKIAWANRHNTFRKPSNAFSLKKIFSRKK